MPYRIISLSCTIIIAALLIFSLYLQFYKHILPCPLCTLQRITFMIIAILFLIGSVAKKIWQRLFISSLNGCFAIIGLLLAGRQVYLQHFAVIHTSECGLNLSYMIKIFSVSELLGKILEGTADCSKIEWEFLHFDMAEWALIWFCILFFVSLYLMFKEFKYK